MANTIIGNTEYKSIKEKAYINGTASEIAQLAGELEKANIRYSGRISDYKSAVTVEASDRSAALEIMRSIKEAARKNSPSGNQPQNNIIGNAEYRFIKDKRFVKGETEAILRVADRLTAEKISFSGRIYGDNATLTVSGDELQEKVKKYFAEEKSSSEIIRTAYMLAQSSVNLEDGYYISEVNVETGDEVQPYRSNYGDIPAFLSVDEAVRYAEGVGIALSNTDGQLNDWRRIEAEAEKEKDRQLNLSRSREIIKRLPMTESGYEEHFIMRDAAVDWIYFNPDGADGEGQFVYTTLYEDDLMNAYNARNNTEDYRKLGQSAFIEVIQNGKQSTINADEEEFERLAWNFINSRENKNIIISAPVISGQGYNVNFERIIERLENHFDEVRKYKENQLTETSENISVEGQIGTWYVVDSEVIDGKKLFLLEHETYGDVAANIIIDENKNVLMNSVWNGFDDYREMPQYNDGKEKINSVQAAELMDYGFTVYNRNRTDILPDNKETRDIFAYNNNYFFYADKKDIEQFNVLSDAVTALDELDSAARREAAQTETEIDTIADYAKDMYDDGDCAYEWNDYGLTEWENIATSILSGDTEYIDSWLRDLRSALPYLEDNQSVSVDAVYDRFEKYKSQFNNPAKEIPLSEQLVSVTDEITEKEAELTDLVNKKEYEKVAEIAVELAELGKKSAELKEKIQAEEITVSDVQDLRSIKPARKSVQNMLNREVAKTPKFEKLLGDEMGEKSAYEMRVSDNAWRNDNSLRVKIIDVSKRVLPADLGELKRKEGIAGFTRGVFTNSFTGTDIIFGRNSIKESVTKAMQDRQHKFDTDARICALYQMNELIENAVFFDSQLSEYGKGAKSKAQNTLFMHKLYSVFRYDGELYLAKLSVEEFYYKTPKREIEQTSNRFYNLRDIKITPTRLPGLTPGADLQNVSKDASLSVTEISIPQLYELVKNNDEKFFENPNAIGRADREAEIKAHEDFSKAMKTYSEISEQNNDKESDIAKNLHLNETPITFSVVSINGGDNIVVGEYIDDESVRYMDEYMTAVSESNSDTVDVQVHFYTIGSADTESIEADEAQVKYISEHLDEVLSQALLLEREMYEVEITDREIENSDRAALDRNLEFTVVTFEDDSVYVLPGKIDDNNIVGTAAYEDMLKNNFDANNIQDLDEGIKVKFDVYHTGNGEAVVPTAEELAEIKNNLDDFIGGKEPVSAEESYLYAWKNVDDILFELEQLWTEKHSADPQISDDFDADNYLLPERLSPIGQNGDTKYYETFSSVRQIKLKDREWLDPVDAVVEMNRRGVNLDDIEMLNVDTVDINGQHSQKDITPEQFAVYEKRIDGNLKLYDSILNGYRKALHSAVNSIKEGDVLHIAADRKNPDELPERYGVVESVTEFNITIGVHDLNDTALCSRHGVIDTSLMKFAKDYDFEYAGNAEEMQRADREQNKELYEALENHDIILLEKQDTKQQENISVENAHKRKFSNLRIEFNKVETDDLDKGFVLKGDTEKEKDLILTCYGEISAEQMRLWLVRDNYTVAGIEKAEKEFDSQEQREISENNDTLYEGDLVTFADRPYITWRVKSITDLQIDFENTNADAQEKIFSHIDFGQNRENLQKTLQYTVISQKIKTAENSEKSEQERLVEAAREAAHKAGLPFRDTSNIPDYDPMEDFDPYAFDGTMSPEDFELMHKLMREDRFEIYQIKSGNEYHSKRFAELDELKETPNVSDYDLVYSGTLSDFDISGENKSDILESIFSKFNTDRPEDFKGHSLSVSDVVVLHKNDEDTAHYVDMIGFEDIPEFLKEKEKQISDKEITEPDVQSEKEKFPDGESGKPSMITLSNDKISYVVVSEVRDALNDLYNGLAPDGEADGGYDWKNYYDAFRAVMDANTHGDIAYPLYNSDAERILRLAYSEDSDTVSDEEFKNALKNLDLVLQNSHLLANPEEKVEQLSFFGEQSSYVSSDEISYTIREENATSTENIEKKETEKEEKAAIDYTLTEDNYNLQSGAKARFNDNIAAIKTLKNIEAEGRKATPAEQEILAKYVGWGGIPQAFDSTKNDWKKEYDELKKLLTNEEYKAAKASTLNAHYTTPTVINAIYSALENMGFNGGKILEPAMGIGNFFGAMPEKMRNNSKLSGVELDSISGRIAMQLYQSADIQINGYENTAFENESFDAAVGNVPFGSYKLNDKEYNKQNLFIHDYFFAKTLDKVRPGGVIAFVTSKGTLDKEKSDVRKYIAERAEFLGAVRLPNTAFKSNAGTEVTSDIIFLQKRDRPISIEENPPEWIFRDILPNGITVNKYFAEHPEMILGEMVEGNKLYGNQTDASMCVPIEGADLKEQLAEAIKNISGEYREAEKGRAEKEILSEIPCPPGSPKFSYIVQDNTLYYRKSGGTMTRVEMPETSVRRIIAMAELRDLVHKLLDLQLENSDGKLNEIIDAARGELNKKYDDFSEKYGLLSSAENKKLFKDDNSYHLLKSLEITDSSGRFLQKADIFTRNTINPKTVVDRCDNAEDALILSLSEKMRVDFDYMSILTGKSEEALIAELGNKIFQNPLRQMRWESADEYLTGNIRLKLAAAEKAGLQRNVDALKAVMPKRIEAADISVKLGSAWIDPEYVRQFIVETIKPDFITGKNISVTYSDVTDKWKVDGWQGGYANTLATETYGTAYMNAYQIIEASLNMKKAEVRERAKDENGNFITDKNGRYVLVVNREKTMIVQAKQDELKRKFQDWIFADPDRRETLVQLYNEKFNSIRLREYDGSHLNFVGMNSAITLKEHQKNAVARALYSNVNTLLAHEVGGGKTYEMVAIAMEGKRLGLHNKSLITAPNALTEQWGEAFRTLYPNANVLVATEKDFKKENRRDLFAKIATGDWDAVIIGHSQFDMIHLSREREIDMLTSEVDRLEAALNEMNADGNGRSFSVKQIEKTIKSYEEKIERLLSKTPEDDMLCFEKLGVDKIFVDESQAYKNLDTPTKMQNVSGIGSGGSGRSMQLLMKCKYLDEITGGKGTIFASGTPISNSMSELYTLMRYLQADKLAEMGINSFDQWASVFGETTSSMELSPEGNGKYQMKTRFAKFQNLPELMNIFKECADIKTAESLNLDRPDFEMHNINVPATKIQAAMIKELGERAKAIRSGTVEPTEDNMCKLTVDGRKIGLDQRCMNPNLPDDPNSKVNVCIRNVFDIWQKTAENKSTQMIFCDLATPQPPLNENRYYIYRKGENGAYSAVYSAKLSEKDTPEKIAKRLNEKPPKDYSGGVSEGDIIVTKNVDYESETAFRKGFVYSQSKLSEIPNEMWEMLHTSPVEPFETERRFCVYDEIKNKLVSMGVPEKEIAFIHDAEKTVDKQLLFDKMNRGEIRVLIGSTQKCGAGMNAQERMIALHDIDAPMRPSDMSQRHGRIIRQGNTNKKVDIYRYTTDKTFDAYLYQMLENKQKFISQIMTDKSPVRSCEDVDEIALDYAEVKALCAGSPLIKEKIDLETEITKLKVLKSAFLSQKYSLQDKAYKTLPERKKYTEHYIEKLNADIETVKSVKPLVNEDGKNYYPVIVGGKEYHDKEQAGQAIRNAIKSNPDIKCFGGTEHTIGSYRGLEMRAFWDTYSGLPKMKVNLKGTCDHCSEINMDINVKASGNIVRLDNIINCIDLELQKQEERLQSLNSDIEEAKAAADAEFPQEQELAEKEKRLAEVDALLSSTDVHADNGKDLYAALIEICPELEQSGEVYCKLEKGADSGIEPFIIERSGDTVFVAHTYVQNGDLMYDPAIEFSFDTKNETAYALTYELSSMGIYRDLRGDENADERTDIEEMALDMLFENVKAYNYEIKELRVGEEKQEEEIDYSQER